MFTITANDNHARTGILRTRTGEYPTPFFMPVATKGAVKYLNTQQLKECGVQAMIANAFLLYLKPGLDVIKNHSDLHGFMQWDRCLFTDSGGFQTLSLKKHQAEITDSGLEFKSPYDGSTHLLTPEKLIQIQQSIGADVAMVLDHMPLAGATREEVEKATERTHRWAVRCRAAHTDRKQLLFGIAQGGIFDDLRQESARYISSLGFDGIALGGVAIGESQEKTHQAIRATLGVLPREKPRYLMGVGSTREIFEAIEHGIDMFDSVWPTRNGRHGRAMLKRKHLRLRGADYKEDMQPIDSSCQCHICKTYTRSYLHHLILMNEPLGMHLVTYHNIFFMQRMMSDIRDSIRTGTFAECKKAYCGELRTSI